VFNFDELSSNEHTAPKSILQIIRRAGGTVASSWVDGKVRRENAIAFKEIHLVFADSQEAVLRVKQSGDIFQVKVNGRATPIKNQDDHKKALIEVIDAVDANSASYQKKLTQTKVSTPTGLKSTVTRKEAALTARIEELKAGIAEATNELAAMDDASDSDDSDDDNIEGTFDADVEWENTPSDDVDDSDDVGATMDGDFKGHPFRGNQYKKGSRQSGSAVHASKSAKRHEKSGDKKALKSAHKSAHYAHKAAAIEAKGSSRKYHNKMARFHGKHGGV
jgi:hypothetical protein